MKSAVITLLSVLISVLGFSQTPSPYFNESITLVGNPAMPYVVDFTVQLTNSHWNGQNRIYWRFESVPGSVNTFFSRQGGSGIIPAPANNSFIHKDLNFYQAGVFDFDIIYTIEGIGTHVSQYRNYVFRPNSDGLGCCEMEVAADVNSMSKLSNFQIDVVTGNIVYGGYDDCGSVTDFNCLKFESSPIGEQVVSAKAQTYHSNWGGDRVEGLSPQSSPDPKANRIESGDLNIWRVHESFTYKKDLDAHIINSTDPLEYKNYDRGTFDYEEFVWRDLSSNDYDKWIRTSRILDYSQNGDPMYEQNALGVSSGAIFGHNNTQMIATVQNGRFFEISFESFEEQFLVGTENYFSNGVLQGPSSSIVWHKEDGSKDSESAHTGNYSLQVKGNDYFDIAPVGTSGIWSNTNVVGNDGVGYLIQVWAREVVTSSNQEIELETNLFFTNSTNGSLYSVLPNQQAVTLEKVANCGIWGLYEVLIPGDDIRIPDAYGNITGDGKGRVRVQIRKQSGADIYVDDARVQPGNSEMVTYVYDEFYRLVANFDSQHFALIYEYNQEGKLIRKLKETVNGVVTLSETQYNSKGIQR